MKLRLSFTSRILLPYLALLILFVLFFLKVIHTGQPWATGLSLCGMILIPVMAGLQLYWLKKSLGRINRLFEWLTRGVIPAYKASGARDEIGEVERNLEKHISNLKTMAAFSRSMASGDFSGQYDSLSSKDELGAALNQLKVSLMGSMKESEARQREEENRTWSAQGLAKFSSLFREAEDNMNELSMQLMKELVRYTEADAGAFYIVRNGQDEEEPWLEDAGTYAFDRQKENRRTFKFGEGLVGRAALEKDSIYLSELPPEYLKIRSGLGEDKPSSILLVPVLLDKEVLGVMELASLGELPSHQIDFVKQLAEALATTVAKVNANLRNRTLFEQTRKQAEELALQEKVFMDNMRQLELSLEQAMEREEALRKELRSLREGSP